MADKTQQTEKPTPRKLEKAHKEGHFPASREFVSALQFLTFVALLSSYGANWLSNLVETSRLVLRRGFHTELTPLALRDLILLMIRRLGVPMLYAGATLVLAGLAAQLAVTRLG